MKKQQIWMKMHKSLMPPNSRCINNKWVFKLKHNSVYWECLLACGYSQVPSVHLSKKHSPIVNNITFCILLLMVIYFGYSAKIINVEEKNYMECPQGTSDVHKDHCTILNKCIYCLVQAARQQYEKAIEILKTLGFIGGNADPCLYVKNREKGIVQVA